MFLHALVCCIKDICTHTNKEMQHWLLRTHSYTHTQKCWLFAEDAREGFDICSEVWGFQTNRVHCDWHFSKTGGTDTVTRWHPLTTENSSEREGQLNDRTKMAVIPALRWIRAGGLWLRAAVRLTPTRHWPFEWRGFHGGQGVSAWGRMPTSEDLPM